MADISSEEYTRPQLMVSDLRPSIITWSTDIPQCLMQSIAMPQLAVFFDSFELFFFYFFIFFFNDVMTNNRVKVINRQCSAPPMQYVLCPVHLSVIWKVAYVNKYLVIFT